MVTNNAVMALTFLQSRPENAAETLELMELQAVAQFLSDVPYTIAGPVVAFMLPQYAARIITFLNADISAAFLSVMNGRRAASILRYTEKNVRNAIISQLPKTNANLLSLLLGYSKDMIGAWMIPNIMLLPEDCTVEDALERLRNTDQHTHGGIVYVVNRDAKLKGSLHVSALLRQSVDVPVSVIMNDEHATLSARATLSSIQEHSGWETRNTLPVLNREKQLIGVLRHIDLYQGLKQLNANVSSPAGRAGSTGLWEVYGITLLALFDAVGGLGTFGEIKKQQEKRL
jgi:magnesium transporter